MISVMHSARLFCVPREEKGLLEGGLRGVKW
ncbi:hypothetical protein Pan44_15270 [Caulifigura coniformis]|uniref:Uncharacterized protein n=1 Tax=Caulifigura coniformis TaxID=2527983 RepID=A0A517SBK8_9PLAN|nr:hypothetical protein Pan44_15270 [Caulifigura coniformis]